MTPGTATGRPKVRADVARSGVATSQDGWCNSSLRSLTYRDSSIGRAAGC